VWEWLERSGKRKTALIELNIDGRLVDCQVTASEPTTGRQADNHGQAAARRIWEAGHALLRRSLATARPMLFIAPTAGKHWGRQFLVVESTASAMRLGDWLDEQCASGSGQGNERALRHCVERLASAVRWMHECGIDHPTLSADSVHIDKANSNCEILFWKLEQVRLRRRVSQRRRVAALALLAASVSHRTLWRRSHAVRFLRRYLKDRFRNEWKPHWRQISSAARNLATGPQSIEDFPLFCNRQGAAS
jgi:hypothetical protein